MRVWPLLLFGGAGALYYAARRYAPITFVGVQQSAAIPLMRIIGGASPMPNEGATNVSANGRNFIKSQEGKNLKAYNDTAGKLTIGYGHLVTLFDGIGAGATISDARADQLFSVDVENVEACIKSKVHVPITQSQFDALASFVFNFGCGAFGSSTLLKKLNAGDTAGAAAEFSRWIYVTDPKSGAKVQQAGLIARRSAEQSMFG